jgi:hypothetical protein
MMDFKFNDLSDERQWVLDSQKHVDMVDLFHHRQPSDVAAYINGISKQDCITRFAVLKESRYSPSDDYCWDDEVLYLETYRIETDIEYSARMLTLEQRRIKAQKAAERKAEAAVKAKAAANLRKQKEAARAEKSERALYETLKKKFEKT